MADNWLTTGICDGCRREKYCKKACTAHKRAAMSFVHNAVMMSMIAPRSYSHHKSIEAVADTIVHDVDKFHEQRR